MVVKQAVKSLNKAYELIAKAQSLIECNIGITGSSEESDKELAYLGDRLQHVLNTIAIDVKYSALPGGDCEDGR